MIASNAKHAAAAKPNCMNHTSTEFYPKVTVGHCSGFLSLIPTTIIYFLSPHYFFNLL